jgi:hypothetical protein
MEGAVAFPSQQCLLERATILRHTTLPVFISIYVILIPTTSQQNAAWQSGS